MPYGEYFSAIIYRVYHKYGYTPRPAILRGRNLKRVTLFHPLPAPSTRGAASKGNIPMFRA
jgi:hypothetical protein